MSAANDTPSPPEPEPNSASMDKFMRGLDAFQKSVSARNAEQVEAAALDILAAAAEHAEQNPTPQLTLRLAAGECEARGDWAGAEACYRKVLALEEATGNCSLISNTHLDLSNLFRLIGDLEQADACVRAATVAARQSGVFPLLVMVLVNQVSFALARSDVATALEAASEAVAAVEAGPGYDGLRASALVARARCRMAAGDWSGGESDLAASQPILLDPHVSPVFAGAHSRAAGWWEVTAGARAHRGNLAGACQAWAEAVQIRRHVASLGHVAGPYTLAALARALRGSGEALEAAGNSEDARAALAEARRIRCELGLQEQG